MKTRNQTPAFKSLVEPSLAKAGKHYVFIEARVAPPLRANIDGLVEALSITQERRGGKPIGMLTVLTNAYDLSIVSIKCEAVRVLRADRSEFRSIQMPHSKETE